MRVVSGKYKGHPLKPMPGKQTRPTTDKVKEAIFQVIGPYFDGGLGLDLFAGSGGLGIEAISRGADKVLFVDKHPRAIQAINQNIQTLNIKDQTEVYKTDAFRALKAAAKRGFVFDWIFLDPPYERVSFQSLFESIVNLNLVQEGSILVCEHSTNDSLPQDFEQLEQMKKVEYGSTIALSLYRVI
ncbi:16S rRNA (guanine(966)-N(2))-methyltransferase RsmD [Salinibacillus xinjiangensis]|uniref:16S rRNA (Guanine(966)-N(2))-methyltransferase RsmD n=1 Tax=Salinibacillus xinjiangensis TaxID=1229268 RepID=A0A6G1X3M9_9BACI|nr:16S rRNA (guanine(966)-N(2))-methyltransferase RsmD [Salinibacillus xinjiangensis]MRG85515.1 16S rRNA (guanine(966)-N(2))-methyltransferase RsmD [Salinibacillus xinjiangensis]